MKEMNFIELPLLEDSWNESVCKSSHTKGGVTRKRKEISKKS